MITDIMFVIVACILFYVLAINGKVSGDKFFKDNIEYFNFLKEDDYDFLLKLRYGPKVDVEQRLLDRLRKGLAVIIVLVFIFVTNKKVLFLVLAFVMGFFIYKLEYLNLKSMYKKHLHRINMLLPYYLKGLEILIHHYTVPVALAKSIEDAPEIFKDGLQVLVDKINAGDSSVNPYMEFAIEYPVRDSMRLMRLLYRLGLGAQENKHEQLLTFSRTISNLQNKSREQKYKARLSSMEKRTMLMLVTTGIGTMILLVFSILQVM